MDRVNTNQMGNYTASVGYPEGSEDGKGQPIKSTETRKCFKCGNFGHLRRECTGEVKPRIVRMVETKADYDKIVRVGPTEVPALLDTGASVTCLREDYAKNMGEPENCNKMLRGFGGKVVRVHRKLVSPITIDEVTLTMECMIVPKWVQDTPLLVGRDFLERDDVEFIKSGGVCTVKWIKKTSEMTAKNANSDRASIMMVEAIDMEQQIYTVGIKNDIEPVREDEINCNAKSVSVASVLELINKYRCCFSKNMMELGKTKDVELKIVLKDSEPVYSKPVRFEYSREAVLQKIIRELLDAKIIVESDSPYSSRIVLVPKKDHEFRMAVDYRLLNQKTVKDRFPLPNIEYCLNKLAGCKVFISVDLFSGYYQIPIEPNSQKFTGFSTADGHYHFLRMPFGLVNGSAVFQRAINGLMRRIKEDGILAYMDDIVIGGESEETVMVKFERLLQHLEESGFTINLKKSKFFIDNLEFLGFEVSAEGVKPGSRKTRAVDDFPAPKSLREVQQFLGLTGFFRRFVKNYSIIATPLSKLLRNEESFVWGPDQEAAFDRLKRALVSTPVLMLYGDDLDIPIEIHTDASALGLGGILLGKTAEGFRPISYFSRKTDVVESKYSSYELEVLAVVASVERFRQYVMGRPFLVLTDCVAVTQTFAKREICPRIARWVLKLQEYDLTFEHKKGQNMRHADALSRNPVEQPETIQPVLHDMWAVEITTEDFLVTMQRQDPKLVEIIGVLGQTPNCRGDRRIHKLYKLGRQRLFRKTASGDKWVVPMRVRWRILKTCHDDMGHMAEEKVLQAVRRHFWFPDRAKYVKDYIKACPKCIYFKTKAGRTECLLNPIPKKPVPFDTIHLDHLGPFVASKKGNSYVIVLTDAFSKFVVIKAIKTTRTTPVIEFANTVTGIFGNPARIITDRGTAFTSNEFKRYCVENCVEHIAVAVGSPRANGQVERSNRTILTAVRSSINDDDRNWDTTIRQVQWAINSLPNSTTTVSPNSVLLTYTPRDILQNEVILAIHDEESVERLRTAVSKVAVEQRIAKRQLVQKRNFDARRRPADKYAVGDMVLVENDLTAMGSSRKLMPKFKGPYMDAKVLGNDRYQIQDVPGAPRTQIPAKSVFAADRIKRWCRLSELEFEGEEETASDDESEETRGLEELFRSED